MHKPHPYGGWLKENRAILMWILVISIALGLRMWNLGAESVWIDEAYSLQLSKLSLQEILNGTAADQHPPLYYLVLHFWLKFYPEILAGRLLSVFFGVLHIALTIHFLGQISKPEIGYLTGLLMAISPFHIWYSQEIRMYMLSALLTTASTFALWHALHKRRLWLGYGVLSLMALYTHYFSIFILAAHGVWMIVWSLHKQKWTDMVRWLSSIGVLLLFFAAWMPTAIDQFNSHQMPWVARPHLATLQDTGIRMLLGKSIFILPIWLRGTLAWIGMGFLLLSGLNGMRTHDQEANHGLKFVLTWTFVPFISIYLFSLFKPVFQFKQFLILLAPLLMAVCISLSKIKGRISVVLYMLLFLGVTPALILQQTNLEKDDWRKATALIRSAYQDGDLIYGNPSAVRLPMSIYWEDPVLYKGYPPGYTIQKGGWEGTQITADIAAEVAAEAVAGHDRIWFVEYNPQFWDPAELLQDEFRNYAEELIDEKVQGIRVRLYQKSGED